MGSEMCIRDRYTTVDVVKVSVDGKMTFVFRDGSTVEVMME